MSTETEDLIAYAENSDLRNEPLVVDLVRSLNQNRKEVGRLLGVLKREQVAHAAALSSSMQEVEQLRTAIQMMSAWFADAQAERDAAVATIEKAHKAFSKMPVLEAGSGSEPYVTYSIAEFRESLDILDRPALPEGGGNADS